MINTFIAAVVTIKFCFFIQVKFNFDAIDETDLLEETLKPRVESIGGTLEKVSLSGNHITPCIQVNRCARLISCFGFLYVKISTLLTLRSAAVSVVVMSKSPFFLRPGSGLIKELNIYEGSEVNYALSYLAS